MPQKLLVTGGNGFVAAQVLIAGLKNGHTIVSTVRSHDKASQATPILAKHVPKEQMKLLTWAVVPDIAAEDAFDSVLKSHEFDAVIHTATPFRTKIDDPHELLDPAIGSTKSLLRSIDRLAPTVKRVVITSSLASIHDPSKGNNPGYVYTEKDWNPITWESAQSGDGGKAYWGAKTYAEKAAWEFMEKNKPHFDLVAICPPLIFGQIASHIDSLDNLNTSSATLYSFVNGSLKGKEIPKQETFLYVDVGDVGKAHIAAVEHKDAGGKRFLVTGGQFTHKEVAETFKKLYPAKAAKIPTKLGPDVDENTGFPKEGAYSGDNSLSVEILDMHYTPLKDSMVAMMKSLEHLEDDD